MLPLSPADLELVEYARRAITARYRPDWHHVGAALRLRDGRVFTGVHLEAYVGRIAVCAEAIALGRAVTEAGSHDIDSIVAVRHPGPDDEDQSIRIVSPCGMCREMITDYSPDAMVIVAMSGKMPIADMLPHKYTRT